MDPNGAYYVVESFAAGGAASLSIGGYGRFLQLHLQGLAGKDSILKADTIRALHTPVCKGGFGWAAENIDILTD